LQTDIANKKKELGKQTTQVKTRQKEIQTIELELRKLTEPCGWDKLTPTEQMVSDLEAAEVEVTEAIAASDKTKAELAALEETMKIQQVRKWLLTFCDAADEKNDYKAAEDKLNKERATLVAFDNELNDLDKDLKIKKKEIVDSELGLKKAEHDTSLIAKERSSLEVMKENLEKQFTWILEEKQ
jgi:structural maintenance of chromosome 2